ncbi:MAG: PCP reductase family protein [Nitrospirae bacterium]|nr:PCP reductase family protein [Nitrospirota bacterium]
MTRTNLDEGAETGIDWSEEAERRLEQIPPFVRPMAKTGIERFARERGYREITLPVMEEAKKRFMG